MHPSVSALVERYRHFQALDAAGSLLNWDKQVLMPPGGAKARNEHAAILSRLEHELLTSDETRKLLERAEKDAEPDSDDAALVRVFRRDLDTRTKLPSELVERRTRVGGEAYEVWKVARAESNFKAMVPFYTELFEIARETSSLLDPKAAHPYDPLHDQFEEGATTATTQAMFEQLKPPLVSLVREIKESGVENDDRFLFGDWDQEQLRSVAKQITGAIGFDYNRGNLSLAPNAFCATISRGDVRMTTKPSENVKGILSSSLHEMGHGLYEQGSPEAWERTPLAGGVSHAVHESQSRLWENVIGRSQAFWSHFYLQLQAAMPSFKAVDSSQFVRALNKVEPSFIRVGADELTYNLHILIRFELEVAMISNALDVKDLPHAWNEKYSDYLGITPPNDSKGVLQDVHWSRGSIGYFPTYTMGNLISAQVWQTLCDQVGDVDSLMARGDFQPILGWLQEKIYSKARRYKPDELVEQVTGRKMQVDDWLAYARRKFASVYLL